MCRKPLLAVVLLLFILLAAQVVAGEVSIGVKEGDWIEYTISTTGTPPEENNLVWAKMEIVEVQGKTFRANMTTKTPNGTLLYSIRNFNFEQGQVEAWIIIPANLSLGDTFYDAYSGSNVTIEGEEEKTFAGAKRTTTYVNTPERHKRWDKATGVFVETIDILENFTVNGTAIATNMWTEQAFVPDQTALYAVILVVALATLITTAVLLINRQKKNSAYTRKVC